MAADRVEALFFELFSGLPRQGPGMAASTRRALGLVPGVGPRTRVLDVGCGTGAQTLVLALSSPSRIVAVDNHPPFIHILNREAQRLGVANRLEARVADMRRLDFADDCSASTTFAGGRSLFLPVPLVVDRESTTVIASDRGGTEGRPPPRVVSVNAATCSVAGRVRPAVHPGPEHAAARGVLRPRRSASLLVCLEISTVAPRPWWARQCLHQVPAHA